MGDLISRQALIEELYEKELYMKTTEEMYKPDFYNGYMMALMAVEQIIEDQPTAYNLESVVGQLEAIKKDRFEWCRMQNMKACNEHADCTEHLLTQIIEIVKAGGNHG